MLGRDREALRHFQEFLETQIHTPDDDVTQLPYGAPSYVAAEVRAD